MRISGTEPSSVILSQKVVSKVGKWYLKSAKTSWSQKGWCNKPTKLQFQLILTRKILKILKNALHTEFFFFVSQSAVIHTEHRTYCLHPLNNDRHLLYIYIRKSLFIRLICNRSFLYHCLISEILVILWQWPHMVLLINNHYICSSRDKNVFIFCSLVDSRSDKILWTCVILVMLVFYVNTYTYVHWTLWTTNYFEYNKLFLYSQRHLLKLYKSIMLSHQPVH